MWRSVWRAARRLLLDRLTQVSAAAVVVVGVLSIFLPPRYSSSAILFPQTTGTTGGNLATIAAQFGLGNFTGGLTVDFYSQVLQSRTIADSVLLKHYHSLLPDTAATLLSTMGFTSGPLAKRLEKGAKRFEKYFSANADETSGLIDLQTSASSPDLSVELTDTVLAVANRVIERALIDQAADQRKFFEARVAEARQELTDREDALARFYNDNRTYQNSPTLVFEEARLRRESDIAHDLYINIRQQYDQARLSEERNTPTLSLVGSPSVPYKPDSPRPLFDAALGGIAVGSVGIALRMLRRARATA